MATASLSRRPRSSRRRPQRSPPPCRERARPPHKQSRLAPGGFPVSLRKTVPRSPSSGRERAGADPGRRRALLPCVRPGAAACGRCSSSISPCLPTTGAAAARAAIPRLTRSSARWKTSKRWSGLGGAAYVYGISSGAALALEAANRIGGIRKLALYEAPFIVDGARPPVVSGGHGSTRRSRPIAEPTLSSTS